MKKCLFLTVFFLVTAMSFANVVKDKLYTVVDNGAIVSLQKTIDIFTTEESIDDICSASCYAEIYYLGELRTTVFASATAGDCVTAITNCLQEAKIKS